MNILRKIPWVFVYVFLLTLSCNALPEQDNSQKAGQSAPISKNAEGRALNSSTEDIKGALDCGIDAKFKDGIKKDNFTIIQVVRIQKSSIPNIPDNIKSIKKIFVGKEDIFDSFSSLHRFSIKNTKSKVSANLYCFKFQDASQASKWFDVVDKAGPLSERLPVLRRPKKLMALANDKVFVIEGYHISSFISLRFILDNIPNKSAILYPDKTTRL